MFFLSVSKFSRMAIELSEAKRFKIFAIESEDNKCRTSVWIDSFISIKISGSILNSSTSISLDLVSVDKFSIKFATSEGCKSFKVWFINPISAILIFSLNIVIKSLLKSKLTFLLPIDLIKLIKIS